MEQTFSHRLRRRPELPRAQRRRQYRRTASVLAMALLSAAWTVQIARPFDEGAGSASPAAAPAHPAVDLPDVELEQPASFASLQGKGPWTVPRRNAAVKQAARSGSVVPFVALAAYQRAATVITTADTTCGADWELLAAIGQVESDHGRSGDNTIGLDGISRPGVYGMSLDGTRNTQAISDTDGGRLDRDLKWDRAVGPMQFTPATWREVAVDADADGERNPQDIDDAALASAVYLCAGDSDLTSVAGRRASLLRYNPSRSYGDLVLRIRAVYLDQGAGADVGFPGGSVSAMSSGNSLGTGGSRSDDDAHLQAGSPGPAPRHEPPSAKPAQPAPGKPQSPPPAAPLKEVVDALDQAVMPLLGDLQATLTCTARGLNVLLEAAAWKRCIADVTG